jgi:DNA ligase-1
MLGTSIEKCKIPEGTWFAISQKLNGSRCFYYKGKLYTRQGKVYTGCEHIIKDIERLDVDYDANEKWEWVYDGELVLKDTSLSDSEAFQKGVGIANSDKENKEELKLVIFDTIPTEQFEKGQSRSPYQARKILLQNYAQRIEALNISNIEIVPMFYEGTDQNEIWRWLDYAEQNDMEGVMVNLDTPYECKRTKNLIKVKKFYTLDLKVTDAIEGDGRLKGTLGALVVDYKGNTVNVGSGFSDAQRKEFWENKDSIIGRVIEVKYKEITKNKDTGLESLQFPVFVSLREEGKEISYD